MEVNKLCKPIISKIVNYDHAARICSVQLPTLKNGVVNVKTLPNLNYFTRYITRIKDSKNNELASYEYDYNYNDNSINGLFLGVDNIKNRRNGSRLGELLRLISIIEMIENKFDSIKLFSKDTAIYFHSRYGFKANINGFSTQIKILRTIVNDKSDLMSDVTSKASALLYEMQQENPIEAYHKYTRQVNEVVNEYIKIAQYSENPYKEHDLKCSIYMNLAKEDVLKRKEFFNDLLKKHNIDYTI